ncbi:MAG: PAS domain S-box protein [Curvibacter sp.]|nr:PAS domain S-box protein [Curvibacter sp.]
MRNNQPVTGRLHQFPVDQTLISVTDLKGRITYCNDNFIMASGYSREELLGQPHNLIRHPDMPEEAFRDMWDTIQQAIPWTGLVKNRRKNGDHYWVRANATPVRSGNQIVGYLSVRTSVTEQETAPFERLYQQMREEAAAGRLVTVLRRGRVVRRTPIGRLHEVLRLGASTRLSLWMALPVVLMGLAWSQSLPSVLGWLLGAVGWALAAWRVRASLTLPLTQLVTAANALAAGDLTQPVAITLQGQWGDLQQALNQLSVGVRTVIRDVRHEVANVRGATLEIANGNQDMSSRTENQAGNLQKTAASLEEITGTMHHTSQMASEGVELVKEAADTSASSQQVVTQVAGTMEAIADASRRIGDILQIIEGIAFQTNILALNAAVEAARAGEQGRGFAVVASEVRALSQRTSQAAREVRELIVSSQERVAAGSSIVEQAQQRMHAAMTAVGKVSALLGQIQIACREQETGVIQINQSVSELDGITQQNAAMVEELAATAHTLDQQVAHVHNTIRVFKLTPKDRTLAEEDAVALRREYAGIQSTEAGEVDFDRVIDAHQQWRIKLRNAALRDLTLDADMVRRDDCCELGKWIYGPGGNRWSHVPLFTQLVQQHKVFHQEAGKVADLVNRKQAAQAQQLLVNDAPMVKIGHVVVNLIRQLRELVQGGAGGQPPALSDQREH